MASGSGTSHLAPDFLSFLLSSKPKFDCYFKVGNERQGNPERIGAVKLMLMAHSEVFRLELEDSDLKEKNDVPIKDIHPDTFKGMLKYVYGHDVTADISFDEADNLLYAAEKYMIKTLKDKLALRLIRLLNTNNICSLMNNPVCYTHLELNAAITQILRYETDQVLASQQFLWMNADGFLKILEQDGLAVGEIELWRAAIKWAKHRAESEAADSEDGETLRRQMSPLTKYFRLCTLTGNEICSEVATTDVLTRDEIGAVCQSVGKKRKLELTGFCDKVNPRIRLCVSRLKLRDFAMGPLKAMKMYSFTITTKLYPIELLQLLGVTDNAMDLVGPKSITGLIAISRARPGPNGSTLEFHSVATFRENLSGVEYMIPLVHRKARLEPNSTYVFNMIVIGQHNVFESRNTSRCLNNHLNLTVHRDWSENEDEDEDEKYCFPSFKLKYRVVVTRH